MSLLLKVVLNTLRSSHREVLQIAIWKKPVSSYCEKLGKNIWTEIICGHCYFTFLKPPMDFILLGASFTTFVLELCTRWKKFLVFYVYGKSIPKSKRNANWVNAKCQFKLNLNEDYWSFWQLKGFPKI